MNAPAYPDTLRQLLADDRLNELGPGQPNLAVQPVLKTLTAAKLLAPHKIHDRVAAEACLAGLWLYHDFLDDAPWTTPIVSVRI